MKKRSGIKLLDEQIGTGEEIQRHKWYRMSFKMWLSKGEPIKWSSPFGLLDEMVISENDQTLTADYRIDREFLFSGLFYGIEGMRIGGKRTLKISPHLAYREKGIEGVVPPNAVLKVEVEIIAERKFE
jgi:FKBP-type peptidyl-prolyl cis-trans isomerase